MKPHLQEAFAKDNREAYLRNKAAINAKNNRYYAKHKERIIASRKSSKVLEAKPSPNQSCLEAQRLDHEHTRSPKTSPANN